MFISREDLDKRYQNHSDAKIIDIAKNSKGLNSDAIEFINREITKRGLDIRHLKRVKAENYKFSEQEKSEIIHRIRSLDCPYCGIEGNLIGFRFRKLTSFVIGYNNLDIRKICCSICFHSKNRINFLHTLILGWWSRFGILSTPFKLIQILYNEFITMNNDTSVFKELFDEKNAYLYRNSKSLSRLQTLIQNFDKEDNTNEIDILT